MSIDLKKKSDNYDHNEIFLSEKFSNINLNVLKENKRIFIPYSELPKNDEQLHSYLDELTAFIEQKIGKHYSYFLVSETEPYEVNGFYIQTAPEIKDRNGNYVNNNDYIYDENSVKWHVTYYYKNNQPCILIDNDDYGYMVVTSLKDFSLNSHELVVNDDLKKIIEEKCDNIENQTFNIGKVALAILLGTVAIAIITLLFINIPDAMETISNFLMNAVDKPEEVSDADIQHLVGNFGRILLRILSISIFLILIRKMLEILRRNFW